MSQRREAILAEIRGLVREYSEAADHVPFVPGKTPIPLIVPPFGWEEVSEAIESMLSQRVTMGAKVRQFEELFAAYLGVKHAVMVNSGSSANLLALSVLTNPAAPNCLRPGDEVITPAVTWATTVWPIINMGLMPVLVDVDPDTFDLIPEQVERAISPRTRAILLVHLLGNPCEMDDIISIARHHDLVIVEDCCEAHGAEYRGRKVGDFGLMATFSFYFSHHISTIEGGMLVTNDDTCADMARALRVFGWSRDQRDAESVAARHGIDPRYLFVNIGYNLRPTEVQGAFGIWQMPKLEPFIEARRDNARYWSDQLARFGGEFLQTHRERPDTRHVWFGYPVVVRPGAPFSRDELARHLEARGVETRPIMAGNIAQQPAMAMFPHRKVGDLPNAKRVHGNAFFFGNHQGVGNDERRAVVGYIEEFIHRYSP